MSHATKVTLDGHDITDKVTFDATTGTVTLHEPMVGGSISVFFSEGDEPWQYGDMLTFKGGTGGSFMFIRDDALNDERIWVTCIKPRLPEWETGMTIDRYRSLFRRVT